MRSKKEKKRFWTKFWLRFWGYFHIFRGVILLAAAIGAFWWLFISCKKDVGITTALIIGFIPFGVLLWRSVVAFIKGKDSFDDYKREQESEIRADKLNKELARYYKNRKKNGWVSQPKTRFNPNPRPQYPMEEEREKEPIQQSIEKEKPVITEKRTTTQTSTSEVKQPAKTENKALFTKKDKNNIINELCNGGTIELDCAVISRFDLSRIVEVARKRKDATIYLTNTDSLGSIYRLIGICEQLKGKVYINHKHFDANLYTAKLAKTGATFFCKRGLQMVDVAEAARGQGGIVTFIGRGSRNQIEKTLKAGGDNVRINDAQ